MRFTKVRIRRPFREKRFNVQFSTYTFFFPARRINCCRTLLVPSRARKMYCAILFFFLPRVCRFPYFQQSFTYTVIAVSNFNTNLHFIQKYLYKKKRDVFVHGNGQEIANMTRIDNILCELWYYSRRSSGKVTRKRIIFSVDIAMMSILNIPFQAEKVPLCFFNGVLFRVRAP